MILVYSTLLVLFILLVWDTVKGFHIEFNVYASSTEIHAHVGSRNRKIVFEIQRNVASPVLIVRLFNKQLVCKGMAAQRKPGAIKKGLLVARSLSVSDLAVLASYGFGDPFYTAMALPAAGVMAGFLPIEHLDVEPDYLSVEPYLAIKGNATIKFGKTISSYLKNKR